MMYEKSSALVTEALRWTPNGSQTASKAPGRVGPLGDYPALADEGHGAILTDVDGHSYLDFICSLAAVGLGHSDGRINSAVITALGRGSVLSLPTPDEYLTSEALVLALGWPEMARWVKTGSEANEAAVRIARLATGRDLVLTVRAGYHAWHSWFQAVKPDHPGVPEALASVIHGIVYGDTGAAQKMLRSHLYACVILEAMPITGDGDPTWLTTLCALARDAGTLVIFDEVVWGFRLAVGGAGMYYDEQPDLATFGKALGNGIPVGVVVGKRDLMAHADLISSTFGGDRLGLAAARTVLDIYADEPIIETLWARGRQLVAGLTALEPVAPSAGFRVTGCPVHPIMRCTGVPVEDQPAVMSLLCQELADRGVLIHPGGCNVMAAMSETDVARAVEMFADALREVERAVVGDAVRAQLRGVPYRQAFARAT